MTTVLVILATVLALGTTGLFLRERWWNARTRTLRGILDDADALERELQECRARMRELPARVSQMPSSLDVSVRATLTAEPQVQAALHDLLQHRLWLRDHGATASLDDLRNAGSALRQSRDTLAAQMQRLAEVCAELDEAGRPA